MKKVIFFVLSSLFILIVPSLKVSAIAYSFGANNFAQDTYSFALPGSWANHGSGVLKTSISLYYSEIIYPLTEYTVESPTVRQVTAVSGNQEYICDIGNSAVSNALNTAPSNNFAISTSITYTVSCPMVMGANGLGGFHIYLDRHGKTINSLYGGPNITFTKSDSQNIINSQQQTTNAVNNLNDSINNDSVSSNTEHSNTAQSWASQSASDSVVSDMVLMPITLLNAFSSGFNGSCQAYNLGSLYGTDLTLPCINIQNYLGATLWGIIDVLMSGFLIYGIGKKFVKVFNDFTNLKDSQVDELYGGGSE